MSRSKKEAQQRRQASARAYAYREPVNGPPTEQPEEDEDDRPEPNELGYVSQWKVLDG